MRLYCHLASVSISKFDWCIDDVTWTGKWDQVVQWGRCKRSSEFVGVKDFVVRQVERSIARRFLSHAKRRGDDAKKVLKRNLALAVPAYRDCNGLLSIDSTRRLIAESEDTWIMRDRGIDPVLLSKRRMGIDKFFCLAPARERPSR